MTRLIDDFCEAFGVWDEARPYLGPMVDEEEMRLVLALGQESYAAEDVAARLGLDLEAAAALLERAYSHHVVDREAPGGGAEAQALYKASRFERLLDYVAKHGRWSEVPEEARRDLSNISNLPVQTANGGSVPLSRVAEISFGRP